MPVSAPKRCSQPGCNVLVRGSSRCDVHKVEAGSFADRRRGSRHERGYGSAWDKLRLEVLRRDAGVCQPHLEQGVVHAGSHVDHRKAKAEGGTDDPANLWCVCVDFHRAKTAQEARRGRSGRR